MFGRIFNGAVIVSWLIAMTWLLAEKVIPPLLGGDPPDYASSLEPSPRKSLPDAWKIRWKARTVGFASGRLKPQPDGSMDRLTFVEFEDLPLESIVSEMLGPVAAVIKPLFKGSRNVDLDMIVATRMRFAPDRRMIGFDTTIDLSGFDDFLKLTGNVGPDGKLAIVAKLSDALGSGQTFKHSVQLPPEALVEGSLSPRAELSGLYVGQTWTIPVFRSFPPNSPVQILEATVEEHELLTWNANEVETKLVVYRTEAGSGVQATRDPISREWVNKDGEILQQQVMFSGLELTFVRDGEGTLDPRIDKLDEFEERLWSD